MIELAVLTAIWTSWVGTCLGAGAGAAAGAAAGAGAAAAGWAEGAAVAARAPACPAAMGWYSPKKALLWFWPSILAEPLVFLPTVSQPSSAWQYSRHFDPI